jgi:hypothetical protein
VRTFVGVVAVVSLVAHLAMLPPTLEDLDSVNFALGVRHFDVSQHQPHPPGYPVFIALGKLATAGFARAGVAAPDVRGLAVWSALASGLLPLLFFAFFRRLDSGDARPAADRRAAIATLLIVCTPLFWFSGARPLSDLAGLTAAWLALAALAIALDTPAAAAEGAASRARAWVIFGAFMAGFSVGFRSQMAMLTMPFLLWALIRAPRQRLAGIAATAAGVAAWGIPLVWFSGGPLHYLQALGSQAGEDFSGVVMLWTHPTPRAAFAAAMQTFVLPWDSPVLAGIVLSLAAAGALLIVRRSRPALVALACAFVPYAIFHLVFQETHTIRYALPLVPLVAFLAAEILASVAVPAAALVAVVVAGAGLALALPPSAAYAQTASPFFSMLSEMRLLQERGAQPQVAMHRRVFTESRRARVYAGDPPGTILPAPRDYEWLELTRRWRDGYQGDAWFVADPRRTDLALVDPAHARTRSYRWPFNGRVYVGGARPDEMDWHILNEPGWFLEEGWALTPETAGVAERDGWGPSRKPSIGWVRRRTAEALMMIGGRNLGGGATGRVIVSVDNQQLSMFEVQPGFFLRFVGVPAGTLSGEGPYARLSVRAEGRGEGASPPVAIEQFNLQAPDRLQFGFDEGWFEPEYNPQTAQSWRWMSERAVIRVHQGGAGSVTLRIRGESPLRYFSAAPHLRVSVGDRVLAEVAPARDFVTEVAIPGDALAAADGRIVLTSDRAFVAGVKEGTADRRRLAVRIYQLTVE